MDTVAQFNIHYIRFLNPQGEPIGPLPAFASQPDEVLPLYRMMVLTHIFDTKAIALQRTGRMGTYPSVLGQEAVSVGIGRAMAQTDVLCPYYREYGAQLQRGVSMSEILSYWGGSEQGNCYQQCPEDFPMAVPIGSQYLHAVGVAVAMKYRQQPRVAVAVCGDGATSQGDVYEALNLAGVWQLPVVFVINNNQWAISVPLAAQTRCKTLAQKAIAAGFSGIQVDGNDVLAMHQVMKDAIAKAREGAGPTLIEALTYRLSDHTTADDASRYRAVSEVENAQTAEPIRRLRAYLLQQKWWDDSAEAELIQRCTEEVEGAVQSYLNQEPEDVTAMFDYHYAHLPDSLLEQREQALSWVDSMTGGS